MPGITEEFASRLFEKLDRDHWGDIDPYLFKEIAKYPDKELIHDARCLKRILKKTLTEVLDGH